MPNARHHSRRALLAITLAGVALAPAAPRAAAPPGGGGKERYDSEVAALRGRLARLRQYAAEFPASLTDVEALAKTLPTPAAALELVRDRLALEPYPGILKGAAGAWLTRGGNALDRALLLAAILRAQDIPAAIAHGRLGEAQARALLQQIAGAPGAVDHLAASIPPPRKGPPPSPEELAVRRLVEEGAAARNRELGAQIDQSLRQLGDALDAAGARPAPDATVAQLVALRDHYWVQATIEDRTVDLDPSFAGAAAGKRFADVADTFDPEEPPEALFQTVRLRVVAVHLDGGRLRETETLAHELRVVDGLDRNLRVAVVPRAARPDVNELRATLLVGQESVEGEPFQLRAEGGAALGRVYLEAITRGPQLREARSRRVILDRLDGEKLLAGMDDRAVRPLLVQIWDAALDVGAVHPLHVLRAHLAALEASTPFEDRARARAYLGRPFDAKDVPRPTLSPDLLSFFLVSGLAARQVERQVAPHARLYHERARLAFVVHGYAVADWAAPGSRARSQHGIDLLDAPFQVVGPRDEAARLARQLGVAETALEAHGADGPAVLNAVPLFAAAARQGVPVLTIAPGKPRALDGLALPAPFKAVLREDLARGRTVILPSRLVTLAGARTFGWWSVEPTGYAIGRMELGGAQGLVESSRMNELITEWTRIYVEFLGGVLRCYMDALADALGGVEIKNMKVKVTVKHGDPGDSPMPEVNELVACVIDKACDAVKELASSYFAGASHFDEGGRLWEMIAHTLEKKATGWATGKAGEGCKAAASAAASAASR